MLSDRQLQALVVRFQLQLAAVGDRTAAATAKAWDRLPGIDRADIETYVRAVAPVVAGSKMAAVSLANGFYSTALQVRTPAIRTVAIADIFDPEAPFLAAWHALKEGRPYSEAVAAGRSQAEAAARNSVISTSRRTADAVVEAGGQRTVGWRRVLDGKACEWCQLVSTQRYKSAESADFGHDRCGCTPLPILGDRDPGRVINKQLLRELKSSPDTGANTPDTGEPTDE